MAGRGGGAVLAGLVAMGCLLTFGCRPRNNRRPDERPATAAMAVRPRATVSPGSRDRNGQGELGGSAAASETLFRNARTAAGPARRLWPQGRRSQAQGAGPRREEGRRGRGDQTGPARYHFATGRGGERGVSCPGQVSSD